ncbi:amidohydrolase [Bacillus sp. OxB-1]|uniref:amidohydrolase n=1 Tax=Bacillus sp. (strain OxB-1) TaxID=98228 RepID=UPI000581E8C3|nr:amidohydrolase [Bacillus sp. OxB-1]BAQ10023.1 amidohydrolase [Bacillus sp. OxB-1]
MLFIQNALFYIGTGKKLEGHMEVVDGKISRIGKEISPTSTAKILDAKGKIITPGLIDVHTHLGINQEGVGQAGHDFNEASSEVTPQVNVIDAINMKDQGIEDARRSGVTTVQIMPGSANVIGGEMVVIKTAGSIVDDCIVRNPSGLKAAVGENPKKYHNNRVQTRMGIAARIREKLVEAQYYMEQRQKGKCRPDLGLENIAKVLRKEIPLRVHAHRADDISTVLRIQKEFDIEITIEHCTEGHHIADLLAKRNIQVSVGPTMSTRPKLELAEQGWNTLTALEKAGVSISLTTDHPVISIEHLMTSAILANKNGLTEQQALQAITLNAAHHLNLAYRIGSLEQGKDADFVIWNGDPFDLRTSVAATFIDGKPVYEKND